ncbi:unnamed protein product, partial [Mesorhabditis spiculigera]
KLQRALKSTTIPKSRDTAGPLSSDVESVAPKHSTIKEAKVPKATKERHNKPSRVDSVISRDAATSTKAKPVKSAILMKPMKPLKPAKGGQRNASTSTSCSKIEKYEIEDIYVDMSIGGPRKQKKTRPHPSPPPPPGPMKCHAATSTEHAILWGSELGTNSCRD